MEKIISSSTGMVHLLASVVALVTGLFILLTTKGTLQHRRIGYVYAISMMVLNITAFCIYHLYGKFGIFHWFAVVSLLTLFAGMYPVYKKSKKDYLLDHLGFMYWSVVGLYCAFMAEIFSRLPNIVLTESGEPNYQFYKGVGIGIAIVMSIGIGSYIKFQTKWKEQFKTKIEWTSKI